MSFMSFETPPYNVSDPHATFLNISCLDLLLIEMVPLAEMMAQRAERIGWGKVDGEEADEGIRGARTPSEKSKWKKKDGKLDGADGAGEGEGEGDWYRDAIFFRLDGWGYRVGQGLSERFSRDRPRFVDNLDVIKFLCKDLWIILFNKQIDNLKTNHRGVYVLTDNKFRPLLRMSMTSHTEAVARAQPHLFFPCGIIRGALFSLGISATVQAETADLPIAVFQIKTVGSNP